MNITIIGKRALLLPALVAGLATPARAADDFITVSRPGDVAATAMLDAKQQLETGIRAYNRGDYAEAFRLFRNVAVLGQAEAHYRLGLMYAEGLGTRKSLNLAAYWLRLATKENYPGAAEALAALRPTGMSS